MKKLFLILVIAASPFFLAAEEAAKIAETTPAKISIAILDLESLGAAKESSRAATELIGNEITLAREFVVIERSRVEEALKEKKSGCYSNECAVELGKRLKANFVVIGSLSLAEDKYNLELRVLNSGNAEVAYSLKQDSKKVKELSALCKSAAQEISGKLGTTAVKRRLKKIKVALPDFTLANDPLGTAKNVYGSFVEELKKNKNLELAEKDEYEGLLKVKGLKDSSCRSTVCLEEAARALGIDKIIIGMATKTLSKYAIEISIYDADIKGIKNTEFFKAGSLNELNDAAVKGAKRVSELFSEAAKGETKFAEAIRKYESKITKRADTSGAGFKVGVGGFYSKCKLLSGYNYYGGGNYAMGGLIDVKKLDYGKISVLSFGLAAEELPLKLPEGTYGQAEDLLGITAYASFNLMPGDMFNPYAGIGLGGYLDMISVDTPVSGLLSATYFFLGFNVKGGVEMNIDKMFSVFGEAKVHFLWEPGKGGMYFATHLTVGGGAIFYIF